MAHVSPSRRRLLGQAAAGGMALWAMGCASMGAGPTPPGLRRGRDFVVAADSADVRPALVAAILAMHRAGGGRVVLAPGLSLSNGPIHLLSGVELHLSAAARRR